MSNKEKIVVALHQRMLKIKNHKLVQEKTSKYFQKKSKKCFQTDKNHEAEEQKAHWGNIIYTYPVVTFLS